MRQSVALQQQWRGSVEQEIADRVRVHQQRVAHLKSARARASAAGAPPSPLVMLAHGDSWFDYPLTGNTLSLEDTDVIAQLRTMGNPTPIILNLSHYGEATTDEMSWPKQQRIIDALREPANWAGGKPDAILFSGGGDDIAGDQFCIYLNTAPATPGLNATRFSKALQAVEASYLLLFDLRDREATNVPVFAHCYDFGIPNGRHPDCVGPWLKPSLDFNGWHDLTQATEIVRQALVRFKQLLAELEQTASHEFSLIDTQGTLASNDWANELHPFPDGFKKIANRFVAALRAKFPGRI
jgi:hypothetical protein